MLPFATYAYMQKTAFLQSWPQITDLPEKKMTLGLISVRNSLTYVSPRSSLHTATQKQTEESGLSEAGKKRIKAALSTVSVLHTDTRATSAQVSFSFPCRIYTHWCFPSHRNRRLQSYLELKCRYNNYGKSWHLFYGKGWGFGGRFCMFVCILSGFLLLHTFVDTDPLPS